MGATLLTVELDQSVDALPDARSDLSGDDAPPLQPPLFTLVLATYGRSDVLGPMLASLAGQSERDFELVVVDQNPDERVVPMLEPIRAAGIPVVHLRASAPNLSAARNRGIEAARGDWVAFPDDDCWYETDCLARVKAAIKDRPQVDGWVANWVEVGAVAAEARRPFDAAVFRAFRGGDASSITLFLRTDTVRQIAGFDVRIGVGRYYGAGEETDLMIRLLDHGAGIERLPAARVHHHHSDERPALSRAALQGVRKRERGVGALYAKHQLRPLVIARGLVAPLLRGLISARPVHGLMFAGVTIAGRIDGMIHWRRHQRGATTDPVTNIGRMPAIGKGHPDQGEKMSKKSNLEGKGR